MDLYSACRDHTSKAPRTRVSRDLTVLRAHPAHIH